MELDLSTFTSKNPMTGELLWEGLPSSEKEVKEAVASARGALYEWSFLSRGEREDFIRNFATTLLRRKDSFAELISKETGKPLWESKAEVDAMVAKAEISIKAQDLRCSLSTKQLAMGTSITRFKPLGVAAVFGPFNFPGHLPNGHIIPALLAGNTVVFKPSELTPRVGEEMVDIWREAGLPKGTINLLQGGAATGKFLANEPDINALFFTGSWKTGRILSEQFAKHPEKLLALEMGGNNPLVVGTITNFEAAAYHIIQSAFLTAGQRCTCARRLIIPDDKGGDTLLDRLVEMTSGLKAGAYSDLPEPFMGPVISKHASNQMLTMEDSLIALGGKSLFSFKELQPDTPLISPCIIDVTEITNLPDEEHFGPLLKVIRVKSFDEAISQANHTAYGLAAGILTDDKKQYDAFFRFSRAGIINWNCPTTGASSEAPFGGVGRSGNYRPSALFAADYCNYPIASIEADSLKIPEKTLPGISINKE